MDSLDCLLKHNDKEFLLAMVEHIDFGLSKEPNNTELKNMKKRVFLRLREMK